jgi:hypothetical protein
MQVDHVWISAPRWRNEVAEPTIPAVVASSSTPTKWRPGHPVGSKNKPKVSSAAPGSSAPSHNGSSPPPKVYSFCIAGAQCRETQRVPLKFTNFMDRRELREAVLREHSGGRNSLWSGGLVRWGRRDVFQGRLVAVCRGSWPSLRFLHDFRLPHRYVEVWREDLRLYSVPKGVRSWSALSLDSHFM